MQVNDIIHGFRITQIRHAEEIQGDMYEMIHEKTNARAIWLKRDDENKTFSIAFKTTPVDDTGVFHILEHSVLNGSDKYPVREPFVDLLKGSLQTFLNAMTYPDKTVYPVSSRNDKDFINLMRVYLDAVFHPLAKSNPNIFYQEGWHYELNEEDGEPIYKGVVFNEMKGAFSSPDGVKGREMMHALFPDNCYGFESGGDPDYITDLSYEQFCNSHSKYYNPSNSYIFLDGDMDIEKTLGIIDDEYLSHYGKEGDLITIDRQAAHRSETVVRDYEISAEQDPKGKAHVTYGYVIGDYDEYEKIAAFSLISSVLCGSNESPLKKAILSNGLGEDVSFDVMDGILQPYAVIDVVNTDLDKEETIRKTIEELFKELIADGLDKEELRANLNQREFKAKERDFGGAPKGLVFALSSLDSWLYDGDPLKSICYGDLFDRLREKIDTDYYEKLLEEYILGSNHSAKILLNPSNTLGQQKAEKEKAKLDALAAGWTKEERRQLTEMNRKLQTWQASEDTPEQKATLPYLHLSDLKDTPTEYPVEVCDHNGNTVLKHNEDTSSISYVNLFAKLDDFTLEDYTVISQMLSYLGKLETEKYDLLTLNRLMRSILGDFNTGISPITTCHDREKKVILTAGYSSLHRNDAEATELVKEIIYHTKFDKKQAIRDLLKQNLFTMEQTFINAGHSLAVQRSLSYVNEGGAVSEYIGGYEAYRYLKKLDDSFDELADGFIERMKELQKKVFIKERYTVSVASEDKPAIVKALLDDAPSGTIGEKIEKKALGRRKEGIVVPANISYAAKSSVLADRIENVGLMFVMSNILTYDYLWNNIRVKGGAYGCGFRSGMAKNASFYSYRDPNPANSLRIYEETPDYLRQFVERNDSVENYVVGTTGDYDPLLSLKAGIRAADLEYLMQQTYEDKKAVLKQILSADISQIEEIIPLFEQINEDDNVCVIGNKDALEKCRDRLDTIFDFNQK